MNYPFHIREINASDPFVLADPVSGKYYTYSAYYNPQKYPELMKKGRFYALESEDLIHWSDPICVFDREDCDFWASEDYWAPECHIWKGKYYLISSFRAPGTYRKCQCLVADSPLGPFRPIRNEAVTPQDWQCLDGTLYEDEKGNPWMVFCHEWLQVGDGQIAAIPLSEDLGSAIGDPVILFRASAAPWGATFFTKTKEAGGYVTDGPYLHRLPDGKLIMLWSTFTVKGYATGYCVSESGTLFGPWKQMENPLYFHDGAHSSLFRTFGGKLMMSLHCPNDHPRKKPLFFEMEETPDGIAIINEITGNWYNEAEGPAKGWVYTDPCTESIKKIE